jgi:hypothetical protein
MRKPVCKLKEAISDNNVHIVEDENINAIQDNAGNQAGALFGKGGAAHGVGAAVSKNI